MTVRLKAVFFMLLNFCLWLLNISFLIVKDILIMCSVVSDSVTPWTVAHPLSVEFSSKNTGVECHFLLQGHCQTQGSNPCLLHLLHWQVGFFFLPVKPPGKPLHVIPVQFSCSVVSNTLQPHGLQHTKLPCHHRHTEPAQTHVHRVGDAI